MHKNLYGSFLYYYIITNNSWRKTYEFRRCRKDNAFDIICKSSAFTKKRTTDFSIKKQ